MYCTGIFLEGMGRNNGKDFIQIVGFWAEFEDRTARLQHEVLPTVPPSSVCTNICVSLHAYMQISLKICFDVVNVKRDTKIICVLCSPIHITTKTVNFPSTSKRDAK